jgi:CO/xanthine dehydrogenase Mo-binding subunit
LVYQDGTVQVNHAGTEMGQGLYTNITAIAARELGIRPEDVRVMPTSTDKVPNTSATAASCGTDLNGAAVKNACEILRARLAPVAARLLNEKNGRAPAVNKLVFADGHGLRQPAATNRRELRGGGAECLLGAHQLVGDWFLCHAGDSLGPRGGPGQPVSLFRLRRLG